MADNNETPPITAPTPATDQAASAVRTVLLIIGAMTAIAGFVAKRDLSGFILYVQSTDGLAFVGLMISIGTIAWGQWKTRHRAKQIVATRVNAPPAARGG